MLRLLVSFHLWLLILTSAEASDWHYAAGSSIWLSYGSRFPMAHGRGVASLHNSEGGPLSWVEGGTNQTHGYEPFSLPVSHPNPTGGSTSAKGFVDLKGHEVSHHIGACPCQLMKHTPASPRRPVCPHSRSISTGSLPLLTPRAPCVEGNRHRVQRLACAIMAHHDSIPLCEGRSPCSNWS